MCGDYKDSKERYQRILKIRIEEAINKRDFKSVNKLINEISDKKIAYELTAKLNEAKEILELAYDRSPIARMVVYELAMLSIRLGEYDEAQIYYEDFVEIAPHDTLKYVIKYRLNKARGVDKATLISILEELKADEAELFGKKMQKNA